MPVYRLPRVRLDTPSVAIGFPQVSLGFGMPLFSRLVVPGNGQPPLLGRLEIIVARQRKLGVSVARASSGQQCAAAGHGEGVRRRTMRAVRGTNRFKQGA